MADSFRTGTMAGFDFAEPCPPVAQAATRIARRQINHRKNSDLRPAVRFMPEPVFDAELGVALAVWSF